MVTLTLPRLSCNESQASFSRTYNVPLAELKRANKISSVVNECFQQLVVAAKTVRASFAAPIVYYNEAYPVFTEDQNSYGTVIGYTSTYQSGRICSIARQLTVPAAILIGLGNYCCVNIWLSSYGSSTLFKLLIFFSTDDWPDIDR